MTKSTLPRAPRITVELTPELIAHAIPRDSGHCMFAEAVRGAVPDASHIAVDLQTVRFTDPKKGLRYTYLTPRVWQLALVEFDQGIPPEPFQTRLAGGQVTAAGKKQREKLDQPGQSDAQRAQRKAASDKGRETIARELRRSSLRTPDGGNDDSVPAKVGGRTPPTTPFARRRAFGLRALVR